MHPFIPCMASIKCQHKNNNTNEWVQNHSSSCKSKLSNFKYKAGDLLRNRALINFPQQNKHIVYWDFNATVIHFVHSIFIRNALKVPAYSFGFPAYQIWWKVSSWQLIRCQVCCSGWIVVSWLCNNISSNCSYQFEMLWIVMMPITRIALRW